MPQDAERLCVAVVDANALFDPYVRDLLLNLAADKRYRPHWTDEILEELWRSRIGRTPEHLLRATIEAMNRSFPKARVKGYGEIIETVLLPDADDRHVLAAAIKIGATHIVTDNLRDFPDQALEPHEIQAISAGGFLAWKFDLNPARTLRLVEQMRLEYSRPPFGTPEEYIALLERRNIGPFTRRLRGQHISKRAGPSFHW